MPTIGYLLALLIAVAILLPLAVGLIRFNLTRSAVIRSVRAATAEQLEAVYQIIESAAVEAPGACLLVRSSGAASSDRNVISLPASLPKFAWAGKRLEIEGDLKGALNVLVADAMGGVLSTLGGKSFRPLRLPARRSKSGRTARNIYAPSALLRLYPT